MRLLTWNCNGALRKKFQWLKDFDADINVIQECENPKKTNNEAYKQWASNHLWIGDNKNKGLGIFAKYDVDLQPLVWSNIYKGHSVKYFLPILINGNQQLLAVWLHKNNSPNFGYIGQMWKYLQINKAEFQNPLVVGDFNSNVIWDQWDRWWNHSDVLREFGELHIESFYHKFFNERQGKESTLTLYLQRKLDKPYHIDYIFGPEHIANALKTFEIGNAEKWLEISDHMPLLSSW
ncbi:endonuclease/exonuclease/phosphatase family protein [Luteibaculum oceani]|uniref:Endonuclease/exonuclease/phosphatase family protein n=1 Tax=Luteibaculum oceani TaxID=1294296 RepID=A0A5C6VB09_9FLAO|nr:endonuclease/exonuclease/phosphatase family protein [Luteibaculum oceani]TXC82090.1 endonuclease/exonuclease/phosphatase family protein [Luteibaculum oceani]